MHQRKPRARNLRSGLAVILALMFITILTGVVVAVTTTSFLGLRKSSNCVDVAKAQLSAESGATYLEWKLRDLRVPPDVTAEEFLTRLHAHLVSKLAVAGASVTRTETGVTVSPIRMMDLDFSAALTMLAQSPPACQMVVTGRHGQALRRLGMSMVCIPKRSSVFDYGVASRGKIVIAGSATLIGMTDADEASVLSTREEPVAIEAGGHATISGDLYVTGEDVDYVLLKGSGLSIGGTSDVQEILDDHVFLGTTEPDFPIPDTAPFAALATNIVDATTVLNGAIHTFNNIRIKAGTNPDFRNGTTLNGIIYVEAPNVVTFHADVTINGMIVTEDASGQPISGCQIDFRGRTSAPGVGVLPNTSEFAAAKLNVGTVLVAPGFGVTFRGTTNSVNGMIAADQLAFRGNSDISGNLTGSVLGLKDLELSLTGNTTIRIKRQSSDVLPAGFRHSMGLTFLSSSYQELLGE